MRLMTLTRPVTLASVAALAIVAAPGVTLAQNAPTVTFTPVAPSSPAAPASQPAATGTYWTLIGGLEADTDGMMYGFFGPTWHKPLREDLELQVSVRPNFLRYEFEDTFDGTSGTRKVSGPGLSTQVGLRFGDRNRFKFGAGPSFKWRDERFVDADGNETEIPDADGDGEDDGMEVGFSLGADAYLMPTDIDNVHAIVSYDTVDEYLWSRLGYKHQISNYDWQSTWAHFVGGEGILQGNDDIRTLMFGGLVEFVHVPSTTAVMLRAGFKRSTFDVADDRTGPYFGINFYRRLGSR
ncbi:MAG: cellulose biosynthesis protein BcsS [Vicinamibacterales bacterium]